MYTNCGCVGPTSESSTYAWSGDYDHVAMEGQCPRPCNTFIAFVAAAFINVLISTIAGNPGFMLQLR